MFFLELKDTGIYQSFDPILKVITLFSRMSKILVEQVVVGVIVFPASSIFLFFGSFEHSSFIEEVKQHIHLSILKGVRSLMSGSVDNSALLILRFLAIAAFSLTLEVCEYGLLVVELLTECCSSSRQIMSSACSSWFTRSFKVLDSTAPLLQVSWS